MSKSTRRHILVEGAHAGDLAILLAAAQEHDPSAHQGTWFGHRCVIIEGDEATRNEAFKAIVVAAATRSMRLAIRP